MSASPESPSGARRESKAAALEIARAEDLFAALRSNDLQVRLSVLAAISRAPAKALSYGPCDGRDLVDEMLGQLGGATGRTHRMALLGTLAAFDDARVAAALRTTFANATTPTEAALCAAYLSRDDAEAVRSFFLPFLEEEARTPQARLAATAVARLGGHAPAMQVRIAVLSDEAVAVPPLDDETEAAWLQALGGPNAFKAMELLDSLGAPAFERLAERWGELSMAPRTWLLGWGCRTAPTAAAPLLLRALDEGPDELRMTAMEQIAAHRDAMHAFGMSVSRFADHQNPKLRSAALRAGAEVRDLRAALGSESSVEARVLLIRRLVLAFGTAALPDLLELLQDGHWQIRSAATTELLALGDAAAEEVQALLEHEDVAVRAAALQVLEGLGRSAAS